jgi:alkanesulfonate monooxygenase SsuD/methylene tetrahydromethanopterin reductase-like flavin-dependent oxidoreductase (luciferase family)
MTFMRFLSRSAQRRGDHIGRRRKGKRRGRFVAVGAAVGACVGARSPVMWRKALSGGRMKLGIFLMPLTPPGYTLGQAMAETTRKALLLDSIGFDEFWLGEHFSATSEPIPSPLMFMAGLLPQTRNLTFGSGVISLPNRHPAVIGGEVAQFDHLANGRFRFGVGTGSLPPDWELFKLESESVRKRMLMESIDIIQAIWRGGPPYRFDGEFWKFGISREVDAALQMGFMPKPRTPEGPPIHISVATPTSESTTIAGERGWGPLSSALLSEKGVAGHWSGYSKGLMKAGRPVDGSNWRVARCVLVAATDAEAERRVFHPDGAARFYIDYIRQVLARAGKLAALKTRPDMADSEVDVDDVLRSRVIFGSPATVRDRLIAFREASGPFDNLLVSGMSWHGPNQEWEKESLTLLAKEVWPAVRRHYADRGVAAAAQ